MNEQKNYIHCILTEDEKGLNHRIEVDAQANWKNKEHGEVK